MNILIMEEEKINKDKQLFTDAFNICWELLKEKNYYLNDRENVSLYSDTALNYGENMFEVMVVILRNIITSNINKIHVNDTPIYQQTTPDNCNDFYNYNNIDAAIDAVVNSRDSYEKDNANIDAAIDAVVKSCHSYENIDEEATVDTARMFKPNEEERDIVNRNYNRIQGVIHYGSTATTSSNDNNLCASKSNEFIGNNETNLLKRNYMDTDIDIKNEPIDIEDFIGIFNIPQKEKSTEDLDDQRNKNDSYANKNKLLNDYVHRKCIEHKNSGYRLTHEVVRNFGYEAAYKLNMQNLNFAGGISWLRNFKNIYNITGEDFDLKINDLPKKDENISTKLIKTKCPHCNLKGDNLLKRDENISKKSIEKNCQNFDLKIDNLPKKDQNISTKSIEKNCQNFDLNINNLQNKDQNISTKQIEKNCQNFDLNINNLPNKDQNISTKPIEKNCQNNSTTDSVNTPTIKDSRENLEKKMENAIRYEKKVKLVDLSYKNPTWSVKKLRKTSGATNISSVERLEKWRNQLKIKKTKSEMFQLINNWVYKKIIDYENKYEITDNQIKQWSIEAKKKFMFKNLHLSSSSNNWLKQFKQNFELTCHYFDLKINPNNGSIEESSAKKIHIPHELKVKVVKLSNEKPSWNIDVLKNHTDCVDLNSDKQLDDWKKKIKKEQSIRDKYDKIYNFIYDKCSSHKNKRKYKKITRKMLIDWRDEAKKDFGFHELPDVEFSPEWISKLKKQFLME
ncbi:hypothetical protein HCN44_008708 [Aphidius gifuensis]|uniref:Uncharacterized protein n=1 Tax=Aphidius gifuensis TaxID=684658 RepID=A0A835CNZ2_APHGI|nr:uncharacterized protein PFB0145c-like [Aphidius gifuensis]KAF7990034.1 hypothetical protein HCN44_008708 [Aphidius gifuensis]